MKPIATLFMLSLLSAPVYCNPTMCPEQAAVFMCAPTDVPAFLLTNTALPCNGLLTASGVLHEKPNGYVPSNAESVNSPTDLPYLHTTDTTPETADTAQQANRTDYWKAYKLYQQAVKFIAQGDKDAAKEALSEGIDRMDELKQKDAEDYALLSMLHTASCQCYSFPRIIASMRGSVKNAEKAEKLDGHNLRVLYALALKDYHTPERHGGFTKVEEIIQRALGLPVQRVSDDQQPSWGRQECYELLTQYLIKKNEMQKAKSIVEKGLKEFPQSEMLQNASKKMQ